jgi:hypothetical protein
MQIQSGRTVPLKRDKKHNFNIQSLPYSISRPGQESLFHCPSFQLFQVRETGTGNHQICISSQWDKQLLGGGGGGGGAGRDHRIRSAPFKTESNQVYYFTDKRPISSFVYNAVCKYHNQEKLPHFY